MADDRTTIQVSVGVWQWLNARKRPGESFDDVLRRELSVPVDPDPAAEETDSPGGDRAEDDAEREVLEVDAERVWYRCGYCGKVFEVAGALVAHTEDNHSEATIHDGLDLDHDVIVGDGWDDEYYCPDCDVAFDDWDEFAAHNEREHGRDRNG